MSLSREEIVRMAREAGFLINGIESTQFLSRIEYLANAAYAAGATAEREACAEIVDNWEGVWHAGGVVEAIRARGNGGEK